MINTPKQEFDKRKFEDLTRTIAVRDVRESDNSLFKSKEWLNSAEAAEYLGLTVQQLHNRTSAGNVPFHKLGRLNRYSLVEIREFLLKNRRGPK